MVIKKYNRIKWLNLPKKETALSAYNLNKMDEGIEYNRNAIKDINDTINTVDLAMYEDIKDKYNLTIESEKSAKHYYELALEAQNQARLYMENAEAVADVTVATLDKAGLVKPDGKSLEINGSTLAVNNHVMTNINTQRIYGKEFSFLVPEGSEKVFIDAKFLSNMASKFIDNIVSLGVYIIDFIYDRLKKFNRDELGSYKVVARNNLYGRLLADGDEITLEPGAMYLLFANSYLSTNGAFRGTNTYTISSAFGIGTSTTAQSIARIAQLGAVGTTGVSLKATYEKVNSDSSMPEYISKLGIGSCTTACEVRYALIKLLASEYDMRV